MWCLSQHGACRLSINLISCPINTDCTCILEWNFKNKNCRINIEYAADMGTMQCFLLYTVSQKCIVGPVHSMNVYRGSRGIAPLILSHDTRWRCVVIFTPQPLCLQGGGNSWYPLHRRLGQHQRQSGHFGEVRNLLPLPGIEPCIAHINVEHKTWKPKNHWIIYESITMRDIRLYTSIQSHYLSDNCQLPLSVSQLPTHIVESQQELTNESCHIKYVPVT